MSEVKVNKISPRSGTAITLGDSGDTFTIPSGATLAIAGSVTGFTSAGIDDNATSVAITINSSEQVGIGTTSPDHLLHISASSSNAQLKLQRTGSATASYNIAASSDALAFSDQAASTERMRITSTGLGVGTSSPSQKLEVSGSSNNIIKSKTTTTTALGGFEAHNSGGTSYLKMFQLGPSFGGTTFGGVTGNDQALIEAQEVSSLAFTTQGGTPDIIFAPARTARMTIKNGGNVGIGTSSPSEKLDVNGTVKATAFEGNGSALTGISGGKVLQVVSASKNDTFITTSTSFVDVTGLTANITPSSSSNKVLVTVLLGRLATDDGGGVSAQLDRGGSSVYDLAQGNAADGFATGGGGGMTNNNRKNDVGFIQYLDSPSSSSSLTYKVRIKRVSAGSAYINRWGLNDDQGCVSSITLMEIAV